MKMVAKKKSNRLSERAMLVHLKTSSWLGRTKDKKITSEVCTAKNSDPDAGSWWTYLIPKHAIRNVEAARMKCRNTHFKYTLPWMDGSLRILPAAMFMDYSKAMREVIAEHETAVKAFLKEYPLIINNAEKRLGKLKENKRLPSVQEIRHKFEITTDILPMPEVSDFRCEIGDQEIDSIKKNISESLEKMTVKAVANIWEQFTSLVEKIEQTMKQPKKIFRDSLFTNLKEFCELIPKLNLTGDNNLEGLRKEAIKKLTQLSAPDLRVSKTERKKAYKSAKEIMDKIKGYTK